MPNTDFFARLGLFVISNFLDDEVCARILEEAKTATYAKAMIKRDNMELIDEEYRNAKEVRVSKETRQFVKDRLLALKPRLERHFNLVLTDLERIQFLLYRPGDFFRLHKDKSPNDLSSKRQVSVILFLNNQADIPGVETYCGGSLTLFGLIEQPQWKEYGFNLVGKAGSLVAFRPDVFHEVKPIIHGERHTVVSWFWGEQ